MDEVSLNKHLEYVNTLVHEYAQTIEAQQQRITVLTEEVASTQNYTTSLEERLEKATTCLEAVEAILDTANFSGGR